MATTASSSTPTQQPVETKGQDLQHAVDLYQKGVEIAHGAATYDDYCRAIELLSLAIAVRSSQPRFFLARGNALRAIGEFEPAARDYSAAIALDDRSPVYFANRGACYRKLGQPAAALEDLTAAVEMDVRKGHHYFSRALVLFEAGYFREAVVDFTRALEDGGGFGSGGSIGLRIEYRALQTRGVCFRRLGNLPKCIDDLESAVRVDARNPAGFSALAQAFYELGDWDRAIEHDSHAIELSKGGSPACFSHRGLCYYRKGEDFARECLADFNSCIKLDGKDPQAYFYRGSVRLWLALELLDANASHTVASTAPSTPGVASLSAGPVASTSGPTGFNTVAKSSLDIAAEANGGLSSSALGFLTAEEQLEAAFADIEMAWSLSPACAQYQLGMAMIAQLRQQHRDAGERFREIGRSDRAHVVAHYHAALAWHMLGEPEAALTLLSDAIDAVPDEPLFFEARALLLQDLQLHALAIDDLSRAVALQDARPNATNLYLRAESLLRLERFDEAVEDANAALRLALAPDVRLSVYNARGMAFRGLGEYERALDDLNVCLADSPGNDIFRFHRGLCFMESARYANAVPDLLAAAKANPRDTKLLYFIGLCYYHEGETSESRKFMRRALRHKPAPETLPDVFYHIGLSCALESRHMAAIESFTAALEHSRALSAASSASERAALLAAQLRYVHERAKALQLERYYDEAVADFSFVLAHNPNNAHACFRRGFAHKARGDLAAAAADFEAAKMLDPTNLQLVVNYHELRDTECVILCPPGQEKDF
ncbi:hypothetical protein PybrP1_006071 [[Pythium] brassicae (nom. inval.)]|nr:hypothetical protein PybrP1_006071 [[Pythium] brassicae (nom. inval.)]